MSDPREIVPIPMSVLENLRRRPVAKADPQVALWMPSWQEGQPVKTGQSFENAVKYGWKRNELIYACIMKSAKAVASVTLRVENATGEELPDHPLRKLITRPNPHMAEFGFHATRVIHNKLSGHSYWEVVRSRAGQPVQLWPLRPDWVSPLLTRAGLVGWSYGPPGVEPTTLAPENVIDIPLFDPMSQFGGTAPVLVAGYAGDIDNAVSNFAKDFFERGALPAGVLKSSQKLQSADVEQIRAMWADRYGGADKWMTAPAVLDMDSEYQRITMSFEEMGFESLDSRNEARICMVLDIPPIVVGANVGLERATYSNYAQADESWWRNSIIPDLKHERDVLQHHLGAEFGAIRLAWDFSEVPALQEDVSAVWERARSHLIGGGITVNEYRHMVGLGAVDGGDVFLRQLSTAPVPLGAIAASVPTGPRPDAGATPDAAPAEGIKASTGPAEVKANAAPDDDERRTHERAMAAAIGDFLAGQGKRVTVEVGE